MMPSNSATTAIGRDAGGACAIGVAAGLRRRAAATSAMRLRAMARLYPSRRSDRGQTWGQTEGQTWGQTEGQTWGQTEGQTWGQTEGQTEGQTNPKPLLAPAPRRTSRP